MNKLFLIIPVYNEEKVIENTYVVFSHKIRDLVKKGLIDGESKILYVNDGSTDNTWNIICNLHNNDKNVRGISLSKNMGHQNALIAGLNVAKDECDFAVSIDCDGQDDINAIDSMIEKYRGGVDIVYGVRNNRDTDSYFKRVTAETYYKILKILGCDIVFNHADYRLMSKRAIESLLSYEESNLFIRGIIPMLGYKTDKVYYKREKRLAGDTHYPFSKMASLAINGVTNLSIRPLTIIAMLGFIFSILSFIGIIWIIFAKLFGVTVSGWTSITCIICLLSGVQLLCIGVLGEYIGKIYMETKHRPKYFIENRV